MPDAKLVRDSLHTDGMKQTNKQAKKKESKKKNKNKRKTDEAIMMP